MVSLMGRPYAFVATAALVCLFLTVCSNPTSAITPTPTGLAGRPSPTSLGAAGCHPASPSGDFPAEVYGTATNGTIWAWFMWSYPPKVGVEDKTLWRLDGKIADANPTFVLTGPSGEAGSLTGLQEHLGSSWNRPGVEYGSGLLFPSTGCWDVHVALGRLKGDVYVVVD